MDLTTGRVLGVEALARWHHPSRGPVSPAKFVPVAEATGLAAALDRWALDRVRRDAAELRRALPRLHVAVNISATHLSDPDLEVAVLSALGTEHITEDTDALAITSSVIRLARTMGLTTIAEGVETPEQLAILRQLGCTGAQGFLFSPAVAPDALPEVVERLDNPHLDVDLAGHQAA
jgi:EAL domain-containing protein (putative c-di-GMP-specific phosphodiesterase class I)